MVTLRTDWPWFRFEIRARASDLSADDMLDLLEGVVGRQPHWMDGALPYVSIAWSVGRTERSKVLEEGTVEQIRAWRRSGIPAAITSVHSNGHGLHPAMMWSILQGKSGLFIGEFSLARETFDLLDSGYAHSIFELACDLLAASSEMSWGAGWLGWYSTPPLAVGANGLLKPGSIFGYGPLVCLPPQAVERLGGLEAVEAGPAQLVRAVVTRTGQCCAVMMLRSCLAEVSDDVLREARSFLAPVAAEVGPEERQAAFERVGARAGSRSYDLPPMVLREDWPEAPVSDDPPEDPSRIHYFEIK